MPSKPAALLLCPENPYPLAGGGAMRTASLAEYLSKRYALDAIVFRQDGAEDPSATRLGEIAPRLAVIDLPVHGKHASARALRNLGRLFRGIPPLTDRFAGFESAVKRFVAGRRYLVGVIEHFWCAGYAASLEQHCDRLVLDLHNIESVLHHHCAETEARPVAFLHRQFEWACRRLERKWFPRFSLLLTASDGDADRVQHISPGAPTGVYPNTIPSLEPPRADEEETIAFSANMEYHPNTTAVRHFRDHMWPALRARWPELRWRLVGKNPEAVRGLVAGDERIELTGAVDDAIRELARARVAVVPLLSGSGTRIKIIEAWAAMTPVVSTSLGAEGLPATPGEHLLIADHPAEFVAAVSSLLSSASERHRLARSARALYEEAFTWECAWKRIQSFGF